MELKISHSIRAKVQKAGSIWEDKAGHRANTAKTVRGEESRDTGSGSMPGPHPYAGKHTAEYKCIAVYGIPEGKKFANDI